MRTLVIGDIHGGLKAFEQCLDRCNYKSNKDEIIFLGDYVDGWTESAELVEELIKFKSYEHPPIFIRGNHDNWCQDWLNTGHAPIIWTQQGGQSTIDSYVRTGHIVSKQHKSFFNDSLQNLYVDNENRIFIHGGWDYKDNEDVTISGMRKVNAGEEAVDCHWDRSLLSGAKSAVSSQNTFKATRMFKEVYIGHTGSADHMHHQYGNLWNMDSGAGWSGKLTIMDIDTKDFWQSDFVKELYPEEKGR